MSLPMRIIVVCVALVGVVVGCGGSSGTDVIGPPSADGGSSGSSGGGSGSGSSGGAVDAPDGGVNPSTAGPGGDTTRVACGTTACTIASETCCVTQTPNGPAYGCVAGSACPAQGGADVAALKCSGAANCADGTVCCVSTTNNVASSSCQPSCGQGQAQLCDPRAASSGCSSGVMCSSANISDWSLPPSYATCGGVGN